MRKGSRLQWLAVYLSHNEAVTVGTQTQAKLFLGYAHRMGHR